MQILEKIIAYIAPHYCIECSSEGKLLCTDCTRELCTAKKIVCNVGSQSKMCSVCHPTTVLTHVWALGEYEGAIERLIHALKFEGMRSAADVFAEGLDMLLPPLPSQTCVVPLPTAPQRVRQRGYDQAVVIAQSFSHRRHLPYVQLLRRKHNLRQVGATREQRLRQASCAYQVIKPPYMPQSILLIDDVLTTGVSLNAAANALRNIGCQEVMAAVAARHT